MLVLSRNIDEDIIFTLETGQTIRVVVLKTNGTGRQVKLGIEAPDSVNIARGELLDRHDGHERRSGSQNEMDLETCGNQR